MTLSPEDSVRTTVTSRWPPDEGQKESTTQLVGESTSPRLIVQRGPEAGKKIPLDQGAQILGREPELKHSISDPRVSRKHLLVCRDGNEISIRDLSSLNGSFLNGEPLEETTSLEPGDIVALGPDTTLKFIL